METFTKESIEQAIQKIDLKPELLKGRESQEYDLLLENGKTYPPILVLSEANKILGGQNISLSDFHNNTRKAFNILRNLGFNVVPKRTLSISREKFQHQKFQQSCNTANLHVSESLAIRFISSLLTKPFVILTGLSGSGKTKLALAFAKWLTNDTKKVINKIFSKGDEVKSNRVSYVVTDVDKIAITFTQSESGTKVTLPYGLINEWIETIKENEFSQEISPRTIRETVEKTTKYSSQLNSFETHLKAAAFHLISKNENIEEGFSIKQVCIIPVGADWTNREPLLGYPNALEPGKYVPPENGALKLIIDAINNPDVPYFLILDEMNLSHVERYFADFLSAMESSQEIPLHSGASDYDCETIKIPSKIILPKNLFIIGTVNIDETTYMFSPKVLDRTSVIEFRVTGDEMQAYLTGNIGLNMDALKRAGENMADNFVEIALNKNLGVKEAEKLSETLMTFFKELKRTGTEFGYRTASEILRFAAVVNLIEPDWTINEIMDAAIMQKLLPKLHGSRSKLNTPLTTLAKFCVTNGTEDYKIKDDEFRNTYFIENDKIAADKAAKIIYPLSFEKLARMHKNVIENGFTSYAEA